MASVWLAVGGKDNGVRTLLKSVLNRYLWGLCAIDVGFVVSR